MKILASQRLSSAKISDENYADLAKEISTVLGSQGTATFKAGSTSIEVKFKHWSGAAHSVKISPTGEVDLRNILKDFSTYAKSTLANTASESGELSSKSLSDLQSGMKHLQETLQENVQLLAGVQKLLLVLSRVSHSVF